MSKVSFQCVAGSGPTLLFKADPIQSLEVTHFIVSNSDSGNANVSVYLVGPGGSPSINNAVIHLYKLVSNSYVEGTGGFVVPVNYSVYVQSSSSNVVVATLSGNLGATVQ